MKPSVIALAVAAAFGLVGCQSDGTATADKTTDKTEQPLISSELYLRGLNDEWGTAPHARLTYLGNNRYETVLKVGRGSGQFKIADPGWKIEYTKYQTPVVFDTSQELFPKPETNDDCMNNDCNSEVTFTETGYYKFSVAFSDLSAAEMMVTRATLQEAEKYYPDAVIDPSSVHKGHRQQEAVEFDTFDGSKEVVTVSVKDPNAALREFGLSTTAELRDALDQGMIITEQANAPKVTTGDLAFDALFALTLKELDQLAVSEIRDGNYNNNQPIEAEVFETGAKWHYVWTRDLAYAADLSLALVNPVRVKNGLEFKLSGFRDSTKRKGEQIIQDTGTGGSWPISTDRTSWALGAERLLSALSGEEYQQFAERAYNALRNTLEADREAAFDTGSGLYRGEQSFLDWREQTYSTWSKDDVNAIGSSKSLSTNVTHYRALRLAQKLAGEFDSGNAERYKTWADQLKTAINTSFWDDSRKMYASYLFDNQGDIRTDKYDMLGEALAITSGIADERRAKEIMANYPHSEFGVPVYFPQQPGIPVYHNRAIWPFVTGYSLRAARVAGNTAAADNAVKSLIRGTATNLSNMENLEWLSGQPLLIHGDFGGDNSLNGPVINSQRQLWSVGSYIGMVTENIFGIDTSSGELKSEPFITSWMRNELFKESSELKLENFAFRGKSYTVVIKLPAADKSATGYYDIRSSKTEGETITVELGGLIAGDESLTVIKGVEPYATKSEQAFSPEEPKVTLTASGNKVTVKVEAEGKYNLYRNDQLIQSLISKAEYVDAPGGYACYVAEAVGETYRSNPSQPVCSGSEVLLTLDGESKELKKGVNIVTVQKGEDAVSTKELLSVDTTGTYQLSAWYSNNQGPFNTGITNAVKRLKVLGKDDKEVASGIIQMGHVDEKNGMRYSTPVEADLIAGESYSLVFEDYFNMSYLASNATYTYSGGKKGAVNSADIAHIRVTRK